MVAACWFGQNADEIGKNAAQNIKSFWDELDYNSATSGGIPPNFFKKLGGRVRDAVDRFSYVGKLERQFMVNGLPTLGERVNRAITPAEMVRLTKKFNLEFGLAYEINWTNYESIPTQNFWIYSGQVDGYGNLLYIPPNITENVRLGVKYHTHPNGNPLPSGADIYDLGQRSWQYDPSGIIPIDGGPPRVVPFTTMSKSQED